MLAALLVEARGESGRLPWASREARDVAAATVAWRPDLDADTRKLLFGWIAETPYRLDAPTTAVRITFVSPRKEGGPCVGPVAAVA